MPIDHNANKRVEEFFSDLKNIADQPLDAPANMPSADSKTVKAGRAENHPASQVQVELQKYQREIETLNKRIHELETVVDKSVADAVSQALESEITFKKKAIPPAPLLYEKERVGYVFSNDKLTPVELVSATLPESENRHTTQLIASGEVIGEMQVHPANERAMTTEDENLASAVAQQVSLQIQNLRLLTAAERARAEALDATRQFTHQSWESFLDGIRNSERIGYAYDQNAVEPFMEPSPDQHDYQETVRVLDEQVGRLFVKADPTRPLSEEDRAMISSVAAQVSQQVENIRLLADAARARADAEAATRRLTRENWGSYTQQSENATLGFIYDSNTVSPIGTETIPSNSAFEQPLIVKGESIGQLTVMGMQNISPEAKELAASIAAQASIHLETLRLNDELQKRAKELQELDRLKSSFLANMSHELRTPLNSILGFADVILEGLDGPLTPNMDNDLRLIQKNGQHLLHLINDVLDMSKIEAGRMNLSPEYFTVNEVFKEVLGITSSLANEKHIELKIAEDSDQMTDIYADRLRIQQVMINLVTNSIKFTDTGSVNLRSDKINDAMIRITVHDTGIGVPSDKLEAIFQEFTQVDVSTTRKVGGTGLGLPITRRLVEMHGGRVWAESEGIEGNGSTFYVELPIEARLTDVVEKTEK